jgi:hypothetical protein
MTKMDTSFKKLFHGHYCHNQKPPWFFRRRAEILAIKPVLRAPFAGVACELHGYYIIIIRILQEKAHGTGPAFRQAKGEKAIESSCGKQAIPS